MSLAAVEARLARYSPRPNVRQALAVEGTPIAALLFSRWFFPQFVERDGCILNVDRFDDETLAAWRATGAHPSSIEAVINRVRLADEWPNDDVPGEIAVELVQVLTSTWRAALDEQFPDRTFVLLAGPEDPPASLTVFQPGSED